MAMKQMGSSPVSSFLACKKGEIGFRNKLKQLGLQCYIRKGGESKRKYLPTINDQKEHLIQYLLVLLGSQISTVIGRNKICPDDVCKR